MKEQSCPNCGGIDPQVIKPGEFQCTFCGTLFHDKELQARHQKQQQQEANARNQQLREQAKLEQVKATRGTGRRVLLFVGIFLLLIFGIVGYFAKQSMDQQNKMQEEMLRQQKEMQEEIMKNFDQ